MANGDNNLPPDPSNYDPRSPINRFAREEARNAADLTDQARLLTEELKDQLGIRSRLNEGQRETVNLSRQLTASAQLNTIEIGNSGNIQRQIAKDQKIALAIEREKAAIIKDGNENTLMNAQAIFSLNERLQKIQTEIFEQGGEATDAQKNEVARLEKRLALAHKNTTADEKRLAVLLGMEDVSSRILEIRKAEAELQDRITDRMGVTGALVKGTGALMERLGMRTGIFQEAMKDSAQAMFDMAEQTERGTANFNKMEIMLKGFEVLSQGFGKALLDPLTIGLAIVDVFIKLNKQQVQVSRLTGQLGTDFKAASAAASLEGAATAIDRLEIMTQLTADIGMNAQNIFSPENIQGAANLKLELGLSADQAGSLAIMAQSTNTSVKDLTDNLVKSTSEFNKQNRSAVSQGMVLTDIGSTSDDIRLSLGGSTDELVAATAQARRLGMTLEDVDEIASSLLEFETSIEKELEAQLLTGKQMNLAKARELALNNDLEGLGKELLKNSVDIHEFGQMNRLEQEAQAAAIGMTRKQLGRVAYLRAIELGMTEEQAAAAANVNIEDMRRITAQENFAKAIEKITSALAPILNLVGDILSLPLAPYIIMGLVAVNKLGLSIKGAFDGIKSLGQGALSMGKNFNTAAKEAGGLVNLLKDKIFGKLYKGGQFMPGGGRAKAGGQRAGGIFSFLKSKTKDVVTGDKTADKTKDISNKMKDSSNTMNKVKPAKNIKTFLRNLGQGLKSMAGMKVLQGALNLIPASLGLVAMIPGVVGAKLMEKVAGPKLLASLQSLSQGLRAMARGKVLLGVAGLAAAAAAFILAIPGAAGMALLGVTGPTAAAGIMALIPALEALGMAMATGYGALGLAALLAAMVGFGAQAALMGAAFMMVGLGVKFAAEGFSIILSQITALVGLGPQILAIGMGLMSIGSGLASIAIAGIGAIPVLGALSTFAVVASPLIALGSMFGAGESEEESGFAKIEAKLDTLIGVISEGGDVYLDSDKVGRTQAKSFSLLS